MSDYVTITKSELKSLIVMQSTLSGIINRLMPSHNAERCLQSTLLSIKERREFERRTKKSFREHAE